MKRIGTWQEAYNTGTAEIDLGDGMTSRIPLGNVVEVIGDAAKAAVDASPKIAQIETVTIPKALADAKEYADEATLGMVDGAYDTDTPSEAFGALTDSDGNLSPFAWTREGRLHPHASTIIREDAAGFADVWQMPGILAVAVDEADNLIYTIGMDGTVSYAVVPEPEPEPEPAPESLRPPLPAPDLAPVDMARWSWWGSSTMGGMGTRYQEMATSHGSTVQFAGGNGGESAEHTLARFGSRPALLTAPATIPAAGPVTIAVDLPAHPGAIGLDVVMGGVRGRVFKASGITEPYVFTRSASGAAVNLPQGMPLLPIKGQEFRGGLLILNVGKNNFTGVSGTTDVQTVVDWTVQAYNHAAHLSKRVLVLGHWLDSAATPAKPEWNYILEYNLRIRDLFGDKFLDLHALVTDPGVWAKTGITPTVEDTAAQAAGIKPPSLSRDALHLNDAGLDLLLAATEAKLTELGWIN